MTTDAYAVDRDRFTEIAATSFVPGFEGITQHSTSYPATEGAVERHTLYAARVAESFMAEVRRLALAAGKPATGWGEVQLDARVKVEHIPHDGGKEQIDCEIEIASASQSLPDLRNWVATATKTWDVSSVLPENAVWGAVVRC